MKLYNTDKVQKLTKKVNFQIKVRNEKIQRLAAI